ncbi:MAG: hypothetical protein Aurels2KO_23430 [Aureliella sp.]
MNDGNPSADGPVLRIEDHRPEAIRIAHQAAELERLNQRQAEKSQESGEKNVSAEQGTSVVIAAASMEAPNPARSDHGAIITSLHESDSNRQPDTQPDATEQRAPENESAVETPDQTAPSNDDVIGEATATDNATDASDVIAASDNASKATGDEIASEDELVAEDTSPEQPTADEAAAEVATEEEDLQNGNVKPVGNDAAAEAEIDSTDEPLADEAAAPHVDEITAEVEDEDHAEELVEQTTVSVESESPEDLTETAQDEVNAEVAHTDAAAGPRLAELDGDQQQEEADPQDVNASQATTEQEEPAAGADQCETPDDEELLAAEAAAAAKIAEEETAAEGLAFIEQIEKKHNQVLDELDALNARIESVLESYLSSRDSGDNKSQEDDKKAA